MHRKQPSVFGWENEPADERPSEFRETTGYSVLSGYHMPSDVNARAARRRTGSRFGFGAIVFTFVLALALSGFAMLHWVKHLRP